MAVTVKLGLITLFLASLAAVLPPFAALGDHALAGRMCALCSLCHRNLPVRMFKRILGLRAFASHQIEGEEL